MGCGREDGKEAGGLSPAVAPCLSLHRLERQTRLCPEQTLWPAAPTVPAKKQPLMALDRGGVAHLWPQLPTQPHQPGSAWSSLADKYQGSAWSSWVLRPKPGLSPLEHGSQTSFSYSILTVLQLLTHLSTTGAPPRHCPRQSLSRGGTVLCVNSQLWSPTT